MHGGHPIVVGVSWVPMCGRSVWLGCGCPYVDEVCGWCELGAHMWTKCVVGVWVPICGRSVWLEWFGCSYVDEVCGWSGLGAHMWTKCVVGVWVCGCSGVSKESLFVVACGVERSCICLSLSNADLCVPAVPQLPALVTDPSDAVQRAAVG